MVPEPLGGGITNVNFTVDDAGERYVVRIGEDIPVHGVYRVNELASARAAHAAGISPEIVHAEPGALVMRYSEIDYDYVAFTEENLERFERAWHALAR